MQNSGKTRVSRERNVSQKCEDFCTYFANFSAKFRISEMERNENSRKILSQNTFSRKFDLTIC